MTDGDGVGDLGSPDEPGGVDTVAGAPPHVLTLLFTDIEGSTSLWERDPERMDEAVARHFDILRQAVARHDGAVVKSTGDGVFATFEDSLSAVTAAVEAQRELLAADWPAGDLRVRMGIHTGPCSTRDGDHYGRAVNKAARIERAAYGGQVLLSGATAALVRDDVDAGWTLVHLGEHHFDGLLDPEVVYQLVAPGLPTDHPPLRTRDLGIGRLPLELTGLVGRAEVAASVQEDLREQRVVSLVGPPGVGKSRLALRIATEAARSRRGGVRFVDLTGCRRVEATDATVATALGVRADDAETYAAGIVRALRATDALLVLDNCEHLLPAVRTLVQSVVRGCPSVTVLAASRERLGVEPELVRPVDALAVPDPGAPPAVVAAAPAVQLLVERARAVVADLAVTDDNAATLAGVARRCDGLPLALELAAARLEALSPTELLAALGSSIDVLAGREGSDPRHSGLRDALDASYGALTPPEQALFDELAVFAGAVPVTAVADVCGRDELEARTLLEGLARRSLVVARRSHEATRFGMLEPVRQYAREHGRVDEALRARHADHFVREAERRGQQYRSPDGRVAARALVGQFDDLRLAFQRLTDRGAWDDAARLVLAVHDFCLLTMRPESIAWARSLVGRLPPTDPRCAELLGVVAIGAWFAGDHQGALAIGAESLEAAARAETPAFTLWAHTAMLNASGFIGDFDGGAQHLIALRDLCRATGDPYWIVNALAVEAVANASIGLHERALAPAARAVRLADEEGNDECRYWAAYAEALALRPTDLDGAEAALDRALAAARSNGSRFNEGNVLMEVLGVHVARGRTGAAAATALDLLDRLEQAGGFAQIWQAVLLSCRALVDGDRAEAAALLHAAVAGRPMLMPVGSAALVADLPAILEQRLEAAALERVRARAAFLPDAQVIEVCRRELEALLRS